MTSTKAALVERVAEDLRRKVGYYDCTDAEYAEADDLRPQEQAYFNALALAAIRAVLLGVREPSEGMCKAPRAANVFVGEWRVHADEARETWEAMIDALLAEIGG